jgi:hypothetical protein
MLIALLLLTQDLPVTIGTERHSAVRLQISGHVDPHYMVRSGAINEAGGVLNGLVLETGSSNAWSGRIGLRVDVEVKDRVSAVIELENRNFDEGLNRPFGSDPETDDLDIKQGYIEAGSPRINLRIGVQDVTFRNRPHDEPFFMDLGEVEGFFDGFSASAIRNTVDRDVREAVGLRLFYTPFEIVTLQALWAVTGEGGGSSDDESVAAFAASALLSESIAVWILAAAVSGGGSGLDKVGTLGAGVDGYLGVGKEIEMFAEGYLQGGRLTADVRKEAFAVNVGSRYVAEKFWVEAAFSHRSGNRRTTDRIDQAFQSYENENRFLILQSAEFGLDVDTNLSVLRAAVGLGSFDLSDRPLRLQMDVGKFAADEPFTASREEDWGVEGDLSLTWSWNESFQFWIKGAWLLGSAILEDLTADREDDARLLVFGAGLKF